MKIPVPLLASILKGSRNSSGNNQLFFSLPLSVLFSDGEKGVGFLQISSQTLSYKDTGMETIPLKKWMLCSSQGKQGGGGEDLQRFAQSLKILGPLKMHYCHFYVHGFVQRLRYYSPSKRYWYTPCTEVALKPNSTKVP